MKKKQCSTAIFWAGTYNNFTVEGLAKFRKGLESGDVKAYVFQHEKGSPEEDNAGTNHLQIHVEFARRLRPSGFFGIKEIRWSVVRDVPKHIIYCQKEYTRIEGPWLKNVRVWEKIKTIEESSFYPWQKQIADIVSGPVDERAIYWFWEKCGGVGKSAFAKWLVVHHQAIVLSGKTADVYYGVQQYMQTNGGQGPRIVILDIPRSVMGYVNYQSLEKVKDGCFFSGKYEGGMCVFNAPHIICFANEEPDMEKMSADRWRIWDIENDF